MFTYATPRELDREHLHFLFVVGLAENNRYNAVRYLYDRLNIIDSKAQGLLTRNSLLLTVISILGSSRFRQDRPAVLLSNPSEQFLFFIGFGLLAFSTLWTAYHIGLRFDNVTTFGDDILINLKKYCVCNNSTACLQANSCFAGKALQLRALFQLEGASFERYLRRFFDITLRRQNVLQQARGATLAATVIFFTLIGNSFLVSFRHG